AFRHVLRQTIFQRLIGEQPASGRTVEDYKIVLGAFIDNLDYDTDRPTIRSLLLLFNIATILLNPKSNLRFPFHHFKKSKWDIEHVRSVKSDKPAQPSQCRAWLQDFASHMGDVAEGKDLCMWVQKLLS